MTNPAAATQPARSTTYRKATYAPVTAAVVVTAGHVPTRLGPVRTATARAVSSSNVYCAICNEWHALRPVGGTLKGHRIKAMHADPMALQFWKLVVTTAAQQGL